METRSRQLCSKTRRVKVVERLVATALIHRRTGFVHSHSGKLGLGTRHNFHYVNVALKYIAQSAATIKLSIIMSTRSRRVLQTEG